MEISKDMLIADLIQKDRGAAVVLMNHGLHCVGCMMAHHENLEQACAVHGVDPEAVVESLNDYFKMTEAADSSAE